MKKQVSIRQALQHVADNPVMKTDVMLDVHAHELVARTLFEIANSASASDTRAMQRANNARSMIFDRLVGKRRAGSHPATRRSTELQFVDLAGEVES